MNYTERKKAKARKAYQERFHLLMDQIAIHDTNHDPQPILYLLIDWLRRKPYEDAPVKKIDLLIKHLSARPEVAASLRQMLVHLNNQKDFTSIFTKVGILSDDSFIGSISSAIRHKIIPPLSDEQELQTFLLKTFHKRYDYRWIKSIPNHLWVELFKTIGLTFQADSSKIREELTDALSLLSYRISSLAYNDLISKKWKAKILDNNRRILLEQNRLINAYIYEQDETIEHKVENADLVSILQINELLAECEMILVDIENNSAKYGTSFKQSHLIQRSKQQLSRMKLILQLLDKSKSQSATLNAFVLLFQRIIERINKRNSIRDIYLNSTKMLAFQITEHKRESGEHYITASRKEYYKFFISAVKGGLVICVAAFIKMLLNHLQLPTFWQYLLFGTNYALAFVCMYFIHGTLATKQPAVTAAALAATMDSKSNEVSSAKVSIMFARVWRSQFASFAGNILTVLPISLGVAILWNKYYDKPILKDALNAMQTLRAQNFLTSLSILYASITGVFLFTAGILNGYINNRVIHSNLPQRMNHVSFFSKLFGERGLKYIATFVSKHLGATIGNVFLGMVLGFAPMIGALFGIPFDIRHITISTAFYAYAITDLNFTLSHFDWVYTSLGVALIGFINFSVSFSLAFITAMRSRNLTISIVPEYARNILKMFLRFPIDFIFPPKHRRQPEDLF